MTVPSNWYEDFFHGVPLDLWRKAVSPEQTKAEVDFLIKALEQAPGAHLLDVPCGNGRHSIELARRGYRVTGIDLSKEFVQEAQSKVKPLALPGEIEDQTLSHRVSASGTDSLSQVEFVLGDMRRIEGEAVYDGAFCFGNSFGYLVYSDMETFLSGVARALKPGARFVIETGMAAESILPSLEERTWYQVEDILMTIEHRYQAQESCLDTEYTFVRAGKSETRQAKHWVYTVAEIRRMLEHAGLAVLHLYGSVDCEPFTLGSRDLLVVAQRGGDLIVEVDRHCPQSPRPVYNQLR